MRVTITNILLLAAMTAVVSCDRWQVRIDTQIFDDGSCTRTVWMDNDTSLIADSGWEKASLVLPMDSARNAFAAGISEWMIPSSFVYKDTARITSISRRFDNVEQMADCPVIYIYDEPVTSTASLTKKFKWFYTSYTYSETFHGWDNTFTIPITDYMSQEEALFMWTGQPNLVQGMTGNDMADALSSYQDKMEHWEYALAWDVWFRTIAEYYSYIVNPPMDKETFLSMRDSLTEYAWNNDMEVFSGNERDVFKEIFHTDTYFASFDADEELGRRFNERADYLLNHCGAVYRMHGAYTLRMPGRITDAGRGIVDGGNIKYQLDGGFLVPASYTITASSRKANVWAFLLSGLVLAVAVGSFLIKR